MNISHNNNITFRIIVFLSLITVFIRNNLDGDLFYYTCYFLILTFGIIHGANDILLLTKGKKANNYIIIKSTLKYLLVVVFISVIFFNQPAISMIFFVLFSAYHFGEQQWTIFENTKLKGLTFFYFSFGALIFFILFTLNSNEVSKIIFDITKYKVDKNFFPIILGFLLLVNTIFISINYQKLEKQILQQSILFIVMLLVFSFFDLLPAFAVYFVFFHSIPSIIEQADYLFEESSVDSFKLFIFRGLVYWILAIVFLIVLYLIVKDRIDLSLGIFFSFLAAITFPHVLVIYKMKENTRK